MRWPWRRRRKDEEDTKQVVRDAEAAVREAAQRGREVRRELNTFAAEVEAALARKRSQ